jgi:hypothetical protein
MPESPQPRPATLRAGQRLIEARRQQNRVIARLMVSQAIASCFEARKAQLKGDGAAGRWLSPLNVHVIPKIGDRAIEDIDQHALRDLRAPIWHTTLKRRPRRSIVSA